MFELGSGQSTLVLYCVFTVFMSGFSCKYFLKSSLHRQWYKYKDLSTVKIELKPSSGLAKCSLHHNQFCPWQWEESVFSQSYSLYFLVSFLLIYGGLGVVVLGSWIGLLWLGFSAGAVWGLWYGTSWGFLGWGSPFDHRRIILGKKLCVFL